MDNFKGLCEDFIQLKKDYLHDINNLIEFLEVESKYSFASKEMNRWIMAVDTHLILDSLKYHVYTTGKYKSKSTALRYMSVVGQLFEYVRYNSVIKVTNLFVEMQMDRTGNSYYIKTLTNYINDCSELKGIVEVMPLSEADALKLIDWSEVQLLQIDSWNAELGHRKALAALAIKFMLMYGITYRELKNVKWQDYYEHTGQILLNGFKLRLPMRLGWELDRWHNFCKETTRMDEYIFVDYSGKRWGDTTSTSRIPDYILPIIGSGAITSIVKYGIAQLIKAGLSESVIKKITGASDTLIQSCVQDTNESLVREINKRIVTVDLYERF